MTPQPETPKTVLRERALRAVARPTFFALTEIELSGHPECATSVSCEVEYYDAPGGFEISSVQPYELRTSGSKGTIHHYLECPEWLEELLVACIDVDKLRPR